MARLKSKELAQQTALQGDTDEAVKQLAAILAGGDVAAAASLAEIMAFRGQWPEMLRYAFAFLRKPDSVYAGNVFTDVLRLVAVAGLKQGGWPDIHGEVVAIRKHLLADPELERYANGAPAMAKGLEQLIKLAKSKGKSPYVWDWVGYSADDEAARVAKFDAALAKQLSAKKKAFDDAADRRSSLLALARSYGSHRSAVRLYDEEGIADVDAFESLLFAASALARAGRTKEAWQVMEKAVPLWWPVDDAQVAPVALLTDEGVRPLMTPERCQWVLRTPRGPAAIPKKMKKKKA